MADDKGASGGGAWGVAEIIIAIILVLALLAKITGKPITPVFDSSSPTTSSTPTTSSEKEDTTTCAITTTRPRPLEVVGDFVVLTGATTGCIYDIGVTPTVTATVVDASGGILSTPTTITPPFTSIDNKMPFEATIPFTKQTVFSTGYIIVTTTTHAAPNTTDTIQAKVPIRFK